MYENNVVVSSSNASHTAPVYSTNISDLDNLLDDLQTARNNSANGHESPRFRDTTESGSRVNQLIQDLENNLKNPR